MHDCMNLNGRHYSSPKAPERLPRWIMNKPMILGGYGMIEISEHQTKRTGSATSVKPPNGSANQKSCASG